VRLRLSLPLVATLAAAPVAAQNSPAMSPAAAIPQWRSFVGANPLGIPFDIVSVELETTVSPAATLGLIGSYNDIDNTRYSTFDARFKYYPAEVAMRGFSVGASFGWTKFRTPETFNNGIPSAPAVPATLNAGTLGVLIDYNWAQGPSQRFVIGTGVGAKRILASQDERAKLDLERAYVTARFVIGLLF
jgi:hypothetical protein